jgi:Ca2+-binding EF-hand superfamily protein
MHTFRDLPTPRLRRCLLALCGLTAATVVAAQTPSPPAVDREVQQKFLQADTNADGALSREEAVAAKFSFSRSFDGIDADRNGQVTLYELGDAMQVRLRAWFSGVDAADRDKDGELTEAEAAAAPEVGKIFKQADTNQDNRLSQQEYETFHRRDLYGNVDLPYVVPNLFEKKF